MLKAGERILQVQMFTVGAVMLWAQLRTQWVSQISVWAQQLPKLSLIQDTQQQELTQWGLWATQGTDWDI